MDNLSSQLNLLASQWASTSQWLFPALWLLLSTIAFKSGRHFSAISLLLAGASAILFSVLFAPNSSFTEGWETDSPTNVSFSYNPVGFLAANLLPAFTNFALVFAFLGLLRRRG